MEAVIKIGMFTQIQTVYVTDETSENGYSPYQVPLVDISKFLMSLDNLHTVKKIQEDTQRLERNKYNRNNIQFLINE